MRKLRWRGWEGKGSQKGRKGKLEEMPEEKPEWKLDGKPEGKTREKGGN